MHIDKLKPQDETKYNELAVSCGSIFNTVEWTNMLGNKTQCYGIYNRGNELIGGFIVHRQRKAGLNIYCDPPFTQSIGPFLKVEASNPSAVCDTWKRVLTQMAEFIEKMNCPLVSVTLNKDVIDLQPFIWKKYKVVPGFTYIIDLSLPVNELLGRMSGQRRKNINKGTKDGLITQKASDFSVIRDLVKKTFCRQGKKVDERFMEKILFEFAGDDNSYAFVTYNGRGPVACSFCLYDRTTAYYLLGGYDNEEKHHGAGAMAMWAAVRHAKEKGLKYFDFEGSMIPQIETYFRGFGGRLTPYFRINKAVLPIEMVLKLFKRELF